jgi:Protein of unknown function (DUF3298)
MPAAMQEEDLHMRTTTAMVAALAALTLSTAPATAVTDSACAALGGTVGADQICQTHNDSQDYVLDIRFPVGYPDQRALTEVLTQQRDDFIDWIKDMPAVALPPELDIIGKDYRSGSPESGTQSLVLTIGNQAGVHPVTRYKSLNYDLAQHVPITFQTLFKPGTQPRKVLDPIVGREVDKRGGTGALTLNDLGAEAYQNFAITDDAVIFFFNQDGLLSHVDGPLTVKVPRTELAALLA